MQLQSKFTTASSFVAKFSTIWLLSGLIDVYHYTGIVAQ